MNDRSQVESQAEDDNGIHKEFQSIRIEGDCVHKAHVRQQCDELARNVLKCIELRKEHTKELTKLWKEMNSAENAFYIRPQADDESQTLALRENLLHLYRRIAKSDTYLKCITDDEKSYRAALDAYIKVNILVSFVLF